ncbi:unnamed protein product [Rotaria socialis]|uniref:Uncharacterized protein n=1 Tax=Rotaria socialis TaxID=392032 RepID=A0A820Y5V8_9BILA|nr:unnamed protein product [Rotaria socialis]CAF4544931.1 unnamed protein product [Rotaria socialis]
MPLLSFRVEVADVLLKYAPPTPPVKRGRPSLDSTLNENNSATKQQELCQVRFHQQVFDSTNSSGRSDLGRSYNDMPPLRNLLKQSRYVRSATASSPCGAHILRVAALALFPNWNSYKMQCRI